MNLKQTASCSLLWLVTSSANTVFPTCVLSFQCSPSLNLCSQQLLSSFQHHFQYLMTQRSFRFYYYFVWELLFDKKVFQSSCSQIFLKLGALKNFANFTGKHLCWNVFFFWRPSGLQLYQKETPTQVLPCEIYEIFKSIFFYRMPPVATSGICNVSHRAVVSFSHLLSYLFLCD